MSKLLRYGALTAAMISGALAGQTTVDTTLYNASGVLVDGDGERQELLIRHQDIGDYMMGMTMMFRVDSWDELPGDLYVGDSITFDLVVLPDDAYVENVVIVKPNALVPRFDPTSKILKIGEPFPGGKFTDSYGRDFDLGGAGHPLRFISFIYTRCPLPTMCPLVDQKHATMADLFAKDGVGNDDLMFVSISFDYQFDTPMRLDEHYGWRLSKSGNWVVLSSVGHEGDLRDVASAAGVDFWGIEEGEVSHTMNSVLVSEDGRLLSIFSGPDWTLQSARDAINAELDVTP